MASDIVIVNGPPGIGKSTVAARLRLLVPGTVAISGDELRAFAPTEARDYLGHGSTYRAAAALASSYLSMGASRVVFDYVFLHRRHVEYFQRGLTVSVPAYLFTLWAPLEMVLERDLERTERERMGPRVNECYREIEENLQQLGRIVPAVDPEPERIAWGIQTAISAGGLAPLPGYCP